MKNIYDDGIVRDNNTIEIIVGRLRKKLATHNCGRIKNLREKGYYLQV
ncbi:TPA: helix-turn-helix domain-containing protein [Klebsiella quasipneumoniae subsp. quasipneumoniae]|nr:helix-turn-helix domain-containing protein [Klebsiella quasipneumoniae subsp. quasipneumoniae]